MSPSNIDHPRKSLRSRSPNTWTIALISKSREHYDLSPLLTTHPHETHVSRTACRTDQWMANQRRRRASVGARMRGGRYDTRRATDCQTKTCRRQTNIACVSVVCFSSFLSRLPRYDGERRDPDHGVKRPCRVLSVCLAPLLVILSSSRLHDSPVNGHADPCICPIARTSDVCPGNCPLRGSENASGVCAPRDGLNRENDTLGVHVCYLLDSKCFVLDIIGGFLDERLY